MKKMSNFEIYPGKGLGDLKFEMTYDDVEKLLGEPDEVINQDEEEDEPETLTAFYDDMGLALYFEQSDFDEPLLLQSIDIDNEHVTFKNKKFANLTKDEIIDYFKQHIEEEPDISSDDDDVEICDFENTGISLQFEGDQLISITVYNTNY